MIVRKKRKRKMNKRNRKLIAALHKVVSDFKTAKTIFMSQGIDPELIDQYFKKFKEGRDKNKICFIGDRNIDNWADLQWDSFVKFVDSLEKTLTKTEERKAPWKAIAPKGSKLVAENNDWVVYQIKSWDAAKALGTKNWCVVRKELHWREFYEGGPESYADEPSNFYFALSKTRSYEVTDTSSKMAGGENIKYDDVFHKVAIQVTPSDIIYWDAEDHESKHPKDNLGGNLNLPPLDGFVSSPDMCDSCQYRRMNCRCCSTCGRPEDNCRCCGECGTYPCECCKTSGFTKQE